MEVMCKTQPLSTASANIAKTSKMHGSMLDVFSMLQRGEIDVGLLSAAQIDVKGNLNSSKLTTKSGKTISLPGSGGAHDISVLANKVVVVMPSDPRRFVNNVDFITSPNMPYGDRKGVVGVAMPDAYFSFKAGKAVLQKIYSDRSAEEIRTSLNWDVEISSTLERIDPPSNRLLEGADIFLQNN
jgi:glutaconate CoA-transferase subunit B